MSKYSSLKITAALVSGLISSPVFAHPNPTVLETRDYVTFTPNQQGGFTVSDKHQDKTTTFGWQTISNRKKVCGQGQQAEAIIYHGKSSLACAGSNIPGNATYTINAFQHSVVDGAKQTDGKIDINPPEKLNLVGQDYKNNKLIMYVSTQAIGITTQPAEPSHTSNVNALILGLQ